MPKMLHSKVSELIKMVSKETKLGGSGEKFLAVLRQRTEFIKEHSSLRRLVVPNRNTQKYRGSGKYI